MVQNPKSSWEWRKEVLKYSNFEQYSNEMRINGSISNFIDEHLNWIQKQNLAGKRRRGNRMQEIKGKDRGNISSLIAEINLDKKTLNYYIIDLFIKNYLTNFLP